MARELTVTGQPRVRKTTYDTPLYFTGYLPGTRQKVFNHLVFFCLQHTVGGSITYKPKAIVGIHASRMQAAVREALHGVLTTTPLPTSVRVMADLAQATYEGVTIDSINQMDRVFQEILARDAASNGDDYPFEEGDIIGNMVANAVLAELEEGDPDDGEPEMEEELANWIDLDDDEAVSDFASDIEKRLLDNEITLAVETAWVKQSTTIAAFCKTVADAVKAGAN